MAKCICYTIKDVEDAFSHIKLDIIKDYGSVLYNNVLHTWDDGKRLLAKCKTCGGYLLIQMSEFHSFSGDDSYYDDYFPIDSPDVADELNKKYNGYEIEKCFTECFICKTNNKLHFVNNN